MADPAEQTLARELIAFTTAAIYGLTNDITDRRDPLVTEAPPVRIGEIAARIAKAAYAELQKP